jgi:hypothetical protein
MVCSQQLGGFMSKTVDLARVRQFVRAAKPVKPAA